MIGRVVRRRAGVSEATVAGEGVSEVAGVESGVSEMGASVDVGMESVGAKKMSGDGEYVSGGERSNSSPAADIDGSIRETGASERRVSRVSVSVDSEMCGECTVFAAGKMFSQNSASPVTKMRLVFLSHSRHALAFDSTPTKMKRLATGPTLDVRLRS